MAVVNATGPPRRLYVRGVSPAAAPGQRLGMWLVQQKGDNSINRLSGIFDSGKWALEAERLGPMHVMYGINRVNETAGSIVDCGANLGAFSIAAFWRHPSLRVVAIEPNPTTYFFFRWNLWLNGISALPITLPWSQWPASTGVHTLNAAVNDDGSDVSFSFAPARSQEAAVVRPGATLPWRGAKWQIQTITVKAVELKAFTQRHAKIMKPIRLLKMDCEVRRGHTPRVRLARVGDPAERAEKSGGSPADTRWCTPCTHWTHTLPIHA